MSETLGARIRRLRQARGWTLRDLAAASGVSVNMLAVVERGEHSISVQRFALIARALGVSMDSLWQGWERWDREAGA